MKPLGDNAFHLDTGLGTNAYLVKGRRGLVLVDPGLASKANPIARDLVRHGLSPYQVTDILITHYDLDHAAGADLWAHRTGARVWVGAADAEIMRHQVPPPNTPFRRAVALLGIPRLPSRARLVTGEDEVTEGIRAVPTPGHTPGHLVFLHRSVGFIGDSALVSSDGSLTRLPAFLDADPALAARSQEVVAALELSMVCAGHSAPVARG